MYTVIKLNTPGGIKVDRGIVCRSGTYTRSSSDGDRRNGSGGGGCSSYSHGCIVSHNSHCGGDARKKDRPGGLAKISDALARDEDFDFDEPAPPDLRPCLRISFPPAPPNRFIILLCKSISLSTSPILFIGMEGYINEEKEKKDTGSERNKCTHTYRERKTITK